MSWRYAVLVLSTLGVLPAQTLFWVAEGDGAIRAAHADAPPVVYAQQTFTGAVVNEARVQDTVLYVLASASDAVFRYRADSLTPRTPWTLPSGSNPYALDFLGNIGLVTLWATDQVALFAADTLVGILSTGRSPQDIAVWQDRFVVVVTGYHRDTYTADSGGIYLHDTTGQVVDSFPRLCVNPQAAEITGDTLWLLCTGNYVDVYGRLLKVLLPTGDILDSMDVATASESFFPVAFWKAPSGLFYVSAYTPTFLPVLLAVDAALRSVQVVPGIAGFTGRPHSLPTGEIVFLEPNYTGEGWLRLLDPAQGTVVDSVSAGSNPQALVYYSGTVVNPDVGAEEAYQRGLTPPAVRLVGRALEILQAGAWTVEVHDASGRRHLRRKLRGPGRLPLALSPGVYLLRINEQPAGKLLLP